MELERPERHIRDLADIGFQDTLHERGEPSEEDKRLKLRSRLLRKESKLEDCLNDDSAHINSKKNSSGSHVEKIQQALETLFKVNLQSEKGKFGRKTSVAVKEFKNARGILKTSQKPGQADETVGKGTIRRLDNEIEDFEQNGGGGRVIPTDQKKRSGTALARLDVPTALSKIDTSIQKLTTFLNVLNVRRTTDSALPAFDPITLAALNTHFRLSSFDAPAIAPRRPVTPADISHIISHFSKMRNVMVLNATSFLDGSPLDKNGNLVAAASTLDSKQIIFSSHFRNFTDAQAQMIGPNSRAAILIHEGFHSVDSAKKSGDDDNVHISEFSPKYDQQSADNSLFNPSSYAGFAAQVFLGRDPDPRFGLGRGRFL